MEVLRESNPCPELAMHDLALFRSATFSAVLLLAGIADAQNRYNPNCLVGVKGDVVAIASANGTTTIDFDTFALLSQVTTPNSIEALVGGSVVVAAAGGGLGQIKPGECTPFTQAAVTPSIKQFDIVGDFNHLDLSFRAETVFWSRVTFTGQGGGQANARAAESVDNKPARVVVPFSTFQSQPLTTIPDDGFRVTRSTGGLTGTAGGFTEGTWSIYLDVNGDCLLDAGDTLAIQLNGQNATGSFMCGPNQTLTGDAVQIQTPAGGYLAVLEVRNRTYERAFGICDQTIVNESIVNELVELELLF
ncbi:MAG: hypothetical protein ACYTFV_04905 [Planctomycetota bacterium]|jgi:hypothetical protein